MSDYKPGALGQFLRGGGGDVSSVPKPKKIKRKIREEAEGEESTPENTQPKSQSLKRKVPKESVETTDTVDDESPIKRKKRVKEPAESKARTVFVGNLPLTTTDRQLKALFKDCGAIESVRLRSAFAANPKLPKKAVVIKQAFHKEATSIGGYVRFKEKESVTEALKLNGLITQEHHLRVDKAENERAKQYDSNKSVFLGNLAFNISDEVIHDHFADCGDIEAVRVIRDRFSGMGKGFGYILFKDDGSSNLALKLNGSLINGRSVRVTPVMDKKEKKKVAKSSTSANAHGSSKKKHVGGAKRDAPETAEQPAGPRNKLSKRERMKDKKSLEELLRDKPNINNILRKKMKRRRQFSKKKA